MLRGSARYLRVSTLRSGGPHSFLQIRMKIRTNQSCWVPLKLSLQHEVGCLTSRVRTLSLCPCLASGAEGETALAGVAGAQVTVRAHGGRNRLAGLRYFSREAGTCGFEGVDGHGQEGSCL